MPKEIILANTAHAQGNNLSEKRIGVFVCRCGSNIAGSVDVEEVTQYARTLPNVAFAQHHYYLCSNPGQQLVKDAIKEQSLNSVVVAACSPRLHEPTFRGCVGEVGLNQFLFEMANVREHCSWPHFKTPAEATEKAKDLVAMAVAKARYLEPLEVTSVPITKKALVVGGGVTGIHAALALADMGFKVYLVERNPTIGGHMAMLDKCFPTLDCSICILGPKMVDVSRHPNIELLTYAEVKSVEGFVGNFKVKVEKKPRYVLSENCVGCGECTEACPIEVPNEFDMGLGARKAIYVPFPQAVPGVPIIDKDNCIECFKCLDADGKRAAIDLEMEPEEIELEVGVIIVAVGYALWDARQVPEYGYGKYENVIDNLEFERMINAAGPTGGEIIRLSDKKRPKKVAFVLCVGSRDESFNPHCSAICCMATLKHAYQLKQHAPDTKIFIFYTDIRASGKGYEEFYKRVQREAMFIRGRVSEIIEDPETKNLLLKTEDTLLGRLIEGEMDLVVLASGIKPADDSKHLGQTLGIAESGDGFFLESHPKLKPVDTATEGIFICGMSQGPKDITTCVAQGTAAAARAARILTKAYWQIEPIVAVVNPEKCTGCGTCAKTCPFGAIQVFEGEIAKVTAAMCHGCGTCVATCPAGAIEQQNFTGKQIKSQITACLAKNPENKIVGFACNWCSYAAADLAGTSRSQYPSNIRIIRVMCSGRVEKDFVLEAFRKGAGMVLVSGCGLSLQGNEMIGSDCHYISGNYSCYKRINALRLMLEKIGINPNRLRLEWISASEGNKLVEVVKDMTLWLENYGLEKIRKENEKARTILEKMTRSAD